MTDSEGNNLFRLSSVNGAYVPASVSAVDAVVRVADRLEETQPVGHEAR